MLTLCTDYFKYPDRRFVIKVKLLYCVCFSFSVFSEEVTEFNALETISQFVHFVDSISSVGLLAEGDNTLLMHCILSFFETVSTCI